MVSYRTLCELSATSVRCADDKRSFLALRATVRNLDIDGRFGCEGLGFHN